METISTKELSNDFDISTTNINMIFKSRKVPFIKSGRFNMWDKSKAINTLSTYIKDTTRPSDRWITCMEINKNFNYRSYSNMKRYMMLYNLDIRIHGSHDYVSFYYQPDVELILTIYPNNYYSLEQIAIIMKITVDELKIRAEKKHIEIINNKIVSSQIHILFKTKTKRNTLIRRSNETGDPIKYKVTAKSKKNNIFIMNTPFVLLDIKTLNGVVINKLTDKSFIFVSDNKNYDCSFQIGIDPPSNINDIISITGGYAEHSYSKGGRLKTFHITTYKLKGT